MDQEDLKDEEYQLELALNTETSFEVLYELARIGNRHVIVALTENPSIFVGEDGEVTDVIASILVRKNGDALVKSPGYALFWIELQSKILVWVTIMILEQTKDPEIIRMLFNTWQVDDNWPDLLSIVLGNENSPMDVIDAIDVDGSVYTKKLIANHRNVSEEKLRKLGLVENEKSSYIRDFVARSKYAPRDLLVRMGSIYFEPSEVVRKSVAENPNTTVAMLEEMLLHETDQSTRKTIRQAIGARSARGD